MGSKTTAMVNAGMLSGIPDICKDINNLRVLIGKQDTNGIKFPKAILICDERSVTFQDFIDNKEWLNENGKWYEDVWYSNEWAERLLVNNQLEVKEYLDQNIKNKRVFCPTQHFQMHFLPTYARAFMLINDNVEELQNILNSKKGTYKEIRYTDEKTISDLYCNAWKYSYDRDEDCFVRLDEDKANFNALHWYMLRDCIRYGGTAYDRIADLSRIIIYLLSKINVDNLEEKQIIDKLTSNIDSETVQKLLKKELFLTEMVNNARKNPIQYVSQNN